MAAWHGLTIPQLVFRFAAQMGMLPLTGTTHAGHMREDLDALEGALSDSELLTLETISEHR